MLETAEGVTGILNPERLSYLNRQPLLFVPFTLWEDGKPALENLLLMSRLQVFSFLHLCIWVSHKHSPGLGAGTWHAQLCHGVSCATKAGACPALPSVAAGWWWQALSQGKEGWPFYSTRLALRGAPFLLHLCTFWWSWHVIPPERHRVFHWCVSGACWYQPEPILNCTGSSRSYCFLLETGRVGASFSFSLEIITDFESQV